MTRVGPSPARVGKTAIHPERVTVAVLTHIPDNTGYFHNRFSVLKLVLDSLYVNTKEPYDLMVFDNGSCSEVVDYLRLKKDEGLIDYLILSRENVGNLSALKIIFNSAPGEIIAYTDDDVLHYPGWLKAQLDILDEFPNVGMVSGVPVRNSDEYAVLALNVLLENIPDDIFVDRQPRIDPDWEWDWAASTGRDPDEHVEKTKDELDIVLKKGDLEAIGGANHFQFIGYKGVLQKALPEESQADLMWDMVQFDQRIDQLGYLRLSTTERFVRHLGNRGSDALLEEAKEMGLGFYEFAELKRYKRHWLLYINGSRRMIKWLYNWTYRVLFLQSKR